MTELCGIPRWLHPVSLFVIVCLAVCDVTTTIQPATTSSIDDDATSRAGDIINSTRCRNAMPPPDHPFKVVWNHPDNCLRTRFVLPLRVYGFTYNSQRHFLGDQIRTLYRTGRWPTISSGGQYYNGGIPQLFNYSDLHQTWLDLGGQSSSFKGLAVLDFEVWRAVYITNFGSLKKYKIASVHLAQQRHPNMTRGQQEKAAEREWEEAARKLMLTKLDIGQRQKPGGYWGYYNYPRTWDGNSTPYQNNKMSWLWQQATGLFPKMYIGDPSRTADSISAMVTKAMTEAVRIQNVFSPPNTAIYPYLTIENRARFYSMEQLEMTLAVPAAMGASGAVLWGSSSIYRDRAFCQRMQTYMHDVLGPFVRNLTDTMANCSSTLCSGHGRCVHNSYDTLVAEEESLRLSAVCAPRDSPFRDYHCRCYSRWGGECCQDAVTSPCQQLPDVDETLIG